MTYATFNKALVSTLTAATVAMVVSVSPSFAKGGSGGGDSAMDRGYFGVPTSAPTPADKAPDGSTRG